MKFPRCAHCGKTLVGRNPERTIFRFNAIPGKPSIGWHLTCFEMDDLATKLSNMLEGKVKKDIMKILDEAVYRSPLRMIAGKAWFKGKFTSRSR